MTTAPRPPVTNLDRLRAAADGRPRALVEALVGVQGDAKYLSLYLPRSLELPRLTRSGADGGRSLKGLPLIPWI